MGSKFVNLKNMLKSLGFTQSSGYVYLHFLSRPHQVGKGPRHVLGWSPKWIWNENEDPPPGFHIPW